MLLDRDVSGVCLWAPKFASSVGTLEFEEGRVCRLTGISNVRLSVIYDTVELFWT